MTMTYDPRRVTLAVFGQNITGFGQSMISVTPNSDLLSHSSGAQGDQATTVIADRSGILEFTLQQNSPVIATLMEFINLADSTGEWPSGACTIKDPSAPILPIMKNCQLMKRPDFQRGSDQSDITFQLFIGDLSYIGQKAVGSQIANAVVQASTIFNAFKALKDVFK